MENLPSVLSRAWVVEEAAGDWTSGVVYSGTALKEKQIFWARDPLMLPRRDCKAVGIKARCVSQQASAQARPQASGRPWGQLRAQLSKAVGAGFGRILSDEVMVPRILDSADGKILDSETGGKD